MLAALCVLDLAKVKGDPFSSAHFDIISHQLIYTDQSELEMSKRTHIFHAYLCHFFSRELGGIVDSERLSIWRVVRPNLLNCNIFSGILILFPKASRKKLKNGVDSFDSFCGNHLNFDVVNFFTLLNLLVVIYAKCWEHYLQRSEKTTCGAQYNTGC